MTKELKKIVAVVGPTAAGKSAIAQALAEEFGGFIVAADSRMVYSGLDIGTNKPTAATRARYGYRMIDVVAPDGEFTLADYQQQTMKILDEAVDLPIVEGGTGLYVASIVDNYAIPVVPPNPALRRRLEARSVEDLYKQLKAVDPETAAFIDPRNQRRLVRALEIKLTANLSRAVAGKAAPKYDTLLLGVERDRAELYRLINERVEEMFEHGFLEEVKSLLDAGYRSSLPALSSIGYREVISYLAGDSTLDEAKALIKKNTRHYAGRQLTWWRRDSRVKWITDASQATSLTRAFLS